MVFFWKTKRSAIKISVIGNCQARPMANIIQALCPKIEINIIGIVHLLKNEEEKIYEQAFRNADYIFAQRVTDNYPCIFVRTEELKKKWGRKVIVWPNLYYRGYNPELIYLRLANRQPLRGPLGDYHNQTFLEGWKNGLSIKNTLGLHNDIGYNREKYGDIPESSLSELKEREEDCDIKIVPYLEKRLRQKRLFFTFNHPKFELLLHTAMTLMNFAGIHSDRIDCPNTTEPLGQMHPPTNAYVISKYGIALDEINIWKGIEINGISEDFVTTGAYHEYQDDEIVDIFYQIYSANKNLIYTFLNHQNLQDLSVK